MANCFKQNKAFDKTLINKNVSFYMLKVITSNIFLLPLDNSKSLSNNVQVFTKISKILLILISFLLGYI